MFTQTESIDVDRHNKSTIWHLLLSVISQSTQKQSLHFQKPISLIVTDATGHGCVQEYRNEAPFVFK